MLLIILLLFLSQKSIRLSPKLVYIKVSYQCSKILNNIFIFPTIFKRNMFKYIVYKTVYKVSLYEGLLFKNI